MISNNHVQVVYNIYCVWAYGIVDRVHCKDYDLPNDFLNAEGNKSEIWTHICLFLKTIHLLPYRVE